MEAVFLVKRGMWEKRERRRKEKDLVPLLKTQRKKSDELLIGGAQRVGEGIVQNRWKETKRGAE